MCIVSDLVDFRDQQFNQRQGMNNFKVTEEPCLFQTAVNPSLCNMTLRYFITTLPES